MLRPCRECKRKVSDQAKTCPHCGIANPGLRPVAATRQGFGAKAVLEAIGGLVGIALVIYLLTGGARSCSSDSPRMASSADSETFVNARTEATSEVDRSTASATMTIEEEIDNYYLIPCMRHLMRTHPELRQFRDQADTEDGVAIARRVIGPTLQPRLDNTKRAVEKLTGPQRRDFYAEMLRECKQAT